MTVKVHFLSYAAVSCGDDNRLAIIDIGDMTEECFIEDGMHSLSIVRSTSGEALDFRSCCHGVLAITCTHSKP